MTVYAADIVYDESLDKRVRRASSMSEYFYYVYLGLALYFCGAVVGLVGVVYLVVNHFQEPNMDIITYAFVGIAVGLMLLTLFFCRFKLVGKRKLFWAQLMAPFFVVMVFFAFYSDWVVAVLNNDLLGLNPSPGGKVFYWTYFAAQKIPFLSN